jgi:GTP cyclohydrolase I
MESALRDFLTAAGLSPRQHPDLAATPALASRAWIEEFLDGYRFDPRDILNERMKAPRSAGKELVSLTRLSYQSVCPHHLLPYGGLAHVCYLPGRWVVGFGQIVQLLDCLSHRLILQEDLARQIADALVAHAGARGAGVLLEAQQSCLALRGGRRAGSRAVAEAFAGALADDGELRQRFEQTARGG